MARWDGLGKGRFLALGIRDSLGAGRFLAVPEQGNLEEGQPRLLADNISNCLHLKLQEMYQRGLSPRFPSPGLPQQGEGVT